MTYHQLTSAHALALALKRAPSVVLSHSLTAEYADNISLHLSMYMCVSDIYDHFCGSFNILKISFIAVVIVAITVTATVQR